MVLDVPSCLPSAVCAHVPMYLYDLKLRDANCLVTYELKILVKSVRLPKLPFFQQVLLLHLRSNRSCRRQSWFFLFPATRLSEPPAVLHHKKRGIHFINYFSSQQVALASKTECIFPKIKSDTVTSFVNSNIK